MASLFPTGNKILLIISICYIFLSGIVLPGIVAGEEKQEKELFHLKSDCAAATLIHASSSLRTGRLLINNNREVLSDGQGNFVFAVPLDSFGTVRITLLDNKGLEYGEYTCEVSRVRYRERQIHGIAKKYVDISVKNKQRIKKEATLVRELRAQRRELRFYLNEDWLMPVMGELSGYFGDRRTFNGKLISRHYGIDIIAKEGVEVRAANSGLVLLSADLFLSGKTVIIGHGGGVTSAYLHLSKSLVQESQTIKKGEVLGYVGSSGRVTGTHLDWRVNWYDIRLDPLSLLVPE